MVETGLVCRHLSFRHAGKSLLLDRLEAHFPAGAVSLVVGATGAGKTTLLHLLGGLLRPTSGLILADNQTISRWRPHHKDHWRRQVGIVFQHLHLIHDMTVLDNVLLPLIPQTKTRNSCQKLAVAALERLDLHDLAHVNIQCLSGGQRQRTAIARAMVHRPRFLLMDEPSVFQDDVHTRALVDITETLADKGACVVICSHDVRLRALDRAFDQVMTLAQGQLTPMCR